MERKLAHDGSRDVFVNPENKMIKLELVLFKVELVLLVKS